jgi:hypothetical protein
MKFILFQAAILFAHTFLGLLQKKAPDGFQAKASWMPELYAELLDGCRTVFSQSHSLSDQNNARDLIV